MALGPLGSVVGRMREHVRAGLDWEGSARALALVRMGMVALVWVRVALPTAWFHHLEDPLLLAACVVLSLSSVLAFVGLWTRISMVALAAAFNVLHLYYGRTLGMAPFDGFVGTWQVVTLLALTPCGRSLSVDRWLAVRRARARGEATPSEHAPLWTQLLLMAQMSAMYLFAGLDKLDAQWLAGERIERIFMRFYLWFEALGDVPLIHAVAVLVAIGTTVLELALGLGLWVPRLRRYLIPGGIALHLSFFFLLALWPLSHRMILMYLVFIDPQRVHDFIDLLLGHGGTTETAGDHDTDSTVA